MARDYRYGHKTKKPTARRTQAIEPEGSVSEEQAQKINVKSSSFLSRRSEKNSDKGVASEQPSPDVVIAEKVPAEDRRTKSMRRFKQAKHKLMPELSAETQKIIDEACRASLPKTIRKEAEQREALAKQEAELLAAEQAKVLALNQEKKQSRFSWGVWGSFTLLILSGVAWLLYAPFFLAFAFEMQWINEATRNRLDPAAAMRSQAISSLSQDKQDLVKPSTSVPNLATAAEDAADMHYSFYRELPKANIVTAALPLPVRTRSPTYLQLASIANDKEAQGERRRLAQKGYLVQMTAQVNKGQTVYVLRMGPYEDQRVINRLKVELQRLGVDAHEVSVISVVKAAEQQAVQPVVGNNTKSTQPVNAPSHGDVQQKVTAPPR